MGSQPALFAHAGLLLFRKVRWFEDRYEARRFQDRHEVRRFKNGFEQRRSSGIGRLPHKGLLREKMYTRGRRPVHRRLREMRGRIKEGLAERQRSPHRRIGHDRLPCQKVPVKRQRAAHRRLGQKGLFHKDVSEHDRRSAESMFGSDGLCQSGMCTAGQKHTADHDHERRMFSSVQHKAIHGTGEHPSLSGQPASLIKFYHTFRLMAVQHSWSAARSLPAPSAPFSVEDRNQCFCACAKPSPMPKLDAVLLEPLKKDP